METMRLLFLLLLTICTTSTGSARAQPPCIDQPLRAPSPPPQPTTLATLDLTADNVDYPLFVTNMRNVLSEKKDGKDVLQCSMLKISATIPWPRYGYVDIKASATQTVTLAINRTNVYVLGYRDKFNGNDRAFFFKDMYNDAKDVFPDAKGNNRISLSYTSQYTALGDRNNVPLGINNFMISISNIYGKATDSNNFIAHQKKFFLIALQMVSEATRFKYISNKIPLEEYDTFTPDAKVVALENGWDTLSTAIYKASECKLQSSVSLNLEGGKKWTFTTVEQIAQVVGLLRANNSTLSKNNDDKDDYGVVVAVASS